MSWAYSFRYLDRDWMISLALALLIHGGIFAMGGLVLVRGVQYGIETGTSGFEVDLVAPAPFSEVQPVSVPLEKDAQVVLPENAVTAHAGGGVVLGARPGYLRNPAPPYPELSRKRGEEGLVVLWASVDRNGRPQEVRVQKSSGFQLLDEAALKAVRKWRFEPARVGSLPVQSKVEIPIRFQLNEEL